MIENRKEEHIRIAEGKEVSAPSRSDLANPPAFAPILMALARSSPLLRPPLPMVNVFPELRETDTGEGTPQFQKVLPALVFSRSPEFSAL